MTNITLLEKIDGVAYISSVVVAEHTSREHEQVLRLIRDNQEDFEAFGRVRFENGPFMTRGGMQNKAFAYLNEHQATLLVTFMRNIGVVKAFKVELVRQFFEMRTALEEAPMALPRTYKEALQALVLEVEKTEALEAQAIQDAPKVEFYEAVAASDANILIEDLARLISRSGRKLGRNRLFEILRQDGHIFKKGGYNLPYQKEIDAGRLTVREYKFEDRFGEVHLRQTTMVTPRGQEYFVRKYQL